MIICELQILPTMKSRKNAQQRALHRQKLKISKMVPPQCKKAYVVTSTEAVIYYHTCHPVDDLINTISNISKTTSLIKHSHVSLHMCNAYIYHYMFRAQHCLWYALAKSRFSSKRFFKEAFLCASHHLHTKSKEDVVYMCKDNMFSLLTTIE